MRLYSDYLRPHGHKPVSDRAAIIFALASVVVIVAVLISGSGLLMRTFY